MATYTLTIKESALAGLRRYYERLRELGEQIDTAGPAELVAIDEELTDLRFILADSLEQILTQAGLLEPEPDVDLDAEFVVIRTYPPAYRPRPGAQEIAGVWHGPPPGSGEFDRALCSWVDVYGRNDPTSCGYHVEAVE